MSRNTGAVSKLSSDNGNFNSWSSGFLFGWLAGSQTPEINRGGGGWIDPMKSKDEPVSVPHHSKKTHDEKSDKDDKNDSDGLSSDSDSSWLSGVFDSFGGGTDSGEQSSE